MAGRLAHHAPDQTPAPALLRALAEIREVDLAEGLGRRRLASVIRRGGPAARRHRLARGLVLVLLAAAAALVLALG